ncbi:hypothetical protein FAM09_21590 [Niastella caeni]|uniref:VCBS repeat-containing protein n=1 Tax=Niastella caeni TaxID=2569763 RepID=A0A4S8HPZ2_9BACT|nr:hypothetical protein [Niastella caeni]THU35984.1 hypothetical protein FAM09_21590 [Niastella caeni]
MKPFLLIIFLSMACVGQSQTNSLASWASDAFRQKGFDKKYEIASFLKPSYWQADFNGDNNQDIVLLITEKQTKKKGILLIHTKQMNASYLVHVRSLAMEVMTFNGLINGAFIARK